MRFKALRTLGRLNSWLPHLQTYKEAGENRIPNAGLSSRNTGVLSPQFKTWANAREAYGFKLCDFSELWELGVLGLGRQGRVCDRTMQRAFTACIQCPHEATGKEMERNASFLDKKTLSSSPKIIYKLNEISGRTNILFLRWKKNSSKGHWKNQACEHSQDTLDRSQVLKWCACLFTKYNTKARCHVNQSTLVWVWKQRKWPK